MDTRALTADFASALEARDAVSIERALARFAFSKGFERYSMFVRHHDFCAGTDFSTPLVISNCPSSFFEFDPDTSGGTRDPVMQHLRRSCRPMVYDQETYTSVGMGHVWEYQAPLGYAFGVATVAHLPEDLHVSFGVDTSGRPPKSQREITTLVAEIQLFSTLMQEAALGIANSTLAMLPGRGHYHLSPRERECLKWAADGKTAWETAQILSLAEGSVAKLIASAIQRLNCTTKPQAVVKAFRLGLIP